MNYKETLDYINSVRLNQWKLGLSRTRELLHMLGDPQDNLKFVHIGGTNGKGSTSAMIESVLRAAGYRTGLFPSPFIEEFRERIKVSSRKISEEDLCRITAAVKDAADSMEDEPSHFEIVTAIGMLYFSEMKCDIVVLEVGLGGEFDATNIIKNPEAVVLTNIGLDHTDYLGTTLEEIARTKSGIIKDEAPVVLYPNVPEVMNVVTEICEERGSELTVVDFNRIESISSDLNGQTFKWDGREISMNMAGDYQMRNAATALTLIEKLREREWKISDENISSGMATAEWPARFELLGTSPLFILDGGHNSQCAKAVVESLEKYLPGRKLTVVTGMLRDKDYEETLDVLLPYADRFYCLTPDSNRALYAEDLAEMIKEKGVPAECFKTAEAALTKCFYNNQATLAFGSLYLAGDIRKAYRNLEKKRLRASVMRARESLSENERKKFSGEICRRLIETSEYKEAHTVLVYNWIGAEVRLDEFEAAAEKDGKKLAYPICVSGRDFLAVEPGEGEDAWTDMGFFGIKEPVIEKGSVIDPADIDLVIAPCVSFDEKCRRLGMGGGFYDKYLPGCTNAEIIAVAYELQKSKKIPTDDFDQSVDMVVTEKGLYTK